MNGRLVHGSPLPPWPLARGRIRLGHRIQLQNPALCCSPLFGDSSSRHSAGGMFALGGNLNFATIVISSCGILLTYFVVVLPAAVPGVVWGDSSPLNSLPHFHPRDSAVNTLVFVSLFPPSPCPDPTLPCVSSRHS